MYCPQTHTNAQNPTNIPLPVIISLCFPFSPTQILNVYTHIPYVHIQNLENMNQRMELQQ